MTASFKRSKIIASAYQRTTSALALNYAREQISPLKSPSSVDGVY